MNNALVSIIIPTYNRGGIIRETLDSVRAQTYPNWECIVVDDGSTDNTEEVVAGYIKIDSRFKYFTRPVSLPKGPNSCRNYGFSKCKGDFVQWFDSDDLLNLKALQTILSVDANKVDAIVGKTDCIDFKTETKIRTNTIFSENLIEDYFVGKVTFFVGGVIWKRSFLEKQKELFDLAIGNMDDWDFNLRMLYQNPKIAYLDCVLFYYRLHQNSFSRELIKLNKNEIISEFNARDKHLELIKSRKDIDIKNIIYPFILKCYKRYLKRAVKHKNEITAFLFKSLILKQLKFGFYKEALRTINRFLKFTFSKKG